MPTFEDVQQAKDKFNKSQEAWAKARMKEQSASNNYTKILNNLDSYRSTIQDVDNAEKKWRIRKRYGKA